MVKRAAVNGITNGENELCIRRVRNGNGIASLIITGVNRDKDTVVRINEACVETKKKYRKGLVKARKIFHNADPDLRIQACISHIALPSVFEDPLEEGEFVDENCGRNIITKEDGKRFELISCIRMDFYINADVKYPPRIVRNPKNVKVLRYKNGEGSMFCNETQWTEAYILTGLHLQVVLDNFVQSCQTSIKEVFKQ